MIDQEIKRKLAEINKLLRYTPFELKLNPDSNSDNFYILDYEVQEGVYEQYTGYPAFPMPEKVIYDVCQGVKAYAESKVMERLSNLM